jgi:hypothetical protein
MTRFRLKTQVIMLIQVLCLAGAVSCFGQVGQNTSQQTGVLNPKGNPSALRNLATTPQPGSPAYIISQYTAKGYVVIGPFAIDSVNADELIPNTVAEPLSKSAQQFETKKKTATPYILKGKRVTVWDAYSNQLTFSYLQPGVHVVMAMKGDDIRFFVVTLTTKEKRNDA